MLQSSWVGEETFWNPAADLVDKVYVPELGLQFHEAYDIFNGHSDVSFLIVHFWSFVNTDLSKVEDIVYQVQKVGATVDRRRNVLLEKNL